jgi:hypothetical protein
MTNQNADLASAIRRLNGRAWGLAGGIILGGGLFLATNLLLLRSANTGEPIGPTLALLRYFFPGYSVSFGGSLIGFAYAFFLGYVAGRAGGSLHDIRHDAANTDTRTAVDPEDESTVEIRQLHAPTWGVGIARASGLGLFLATVALVVRGSVDGQPVGPTLGQLSYFFPGYSVSWLGAVIGLLYAGGSGYLVGASIVRIYNRLVRRS